MKAIAFLSQKGGAGKTTLTLHCAVQAEALGRQVVIADTDPQASASSWACVRASSTPLVEKVDALSLQRRLDAARNDAIDYVLVDCAPHAGPEAVSICRAVDLVLIPVRPSALDLAAAVQTVQIVRRAGVRAAFVLSACPFRAPEIGEARMVLSKYADIPVSPVQITELRAFSRAISTGSSVLEFDPVGKAAAEVAALWGWIENGGLRNE